MKKTSVFAVLAASLILSACAGGGSGGGGAVPSSPGGGGGGGGTTTTQATVKTIVTIGGTAAQAVALYHRHALATGRTPQYVSPSTLGVSVTASGGGGTFVFNVSAGSPLCTSGAPRTCTLSFPITAGSYTFTMTLYDAAPVGGAIPGGAKSLGASSVAQTINPLQANTLNFYVGGIVGGVGVSGGTTFTSLPADGAAHSYNVALIVTDADGNVITTGGSSPYSNPVTVTLTESGGSGHAQLFKNGSASGTSATLSQSTDTLSLHYDGAGAAGYTTSTAITASGATGSTLKVSPLYASQSTVTVYRPWDATHPVSTSLTISEQGASTPATINNAPCGTKVGFSTTTIPNANGSTTVTAGPLDSVSCAPTVSDVYGSSLTLTAQVDPAYVSGTVVTKVGPLGVGGGDALWSPIGGFDSNLWAIEYTFSGAGPCYYYLLSLDSTGAQVHKFCSAQVEEPSMLVAGSDGNYWAIIQSGAREGAEVWTPAGVNIAFHPFAFSSGNSLNVAQNAVVGSDGNIWMTNAGGGAGGPCKFGRLTTSGAFTEFSSGAACGTAYSLVKAPDGNVWFSYQDGSASVRGVGKITPTGVVSLYQDPGGLPDFFIASGPDGNMWVCGNYSGVQRINYGGVWQSTLPTGFATYGSPSTWFAPNPTNNTIAVANTAGTPNVVPSSINAAGVVTTNPTITMPIQFLQTQTSVAANGMLWITAQDYSNKFYTYEIEP